MAIKSSAVRRAGFCGTWPAGMQATGTSTVFVGGTVTAWLAQPAYNVVSADHPTISLLLDPLSGSGLPRFVLWSCWLYAGYRLVRR